MPEKKGLVSSKLKQNKNTINRGIGGLVGHYFDFPNTSYMFPLALFGARSD